MAAALGLAGDRAYRRWEDGDRGIPGTVAMLVWLMLNCPEARERLLADAAEAA